MTNEEILQSLNEKITASTEALMYLNQCKSHFKTFTNMKMTDQQLIERIAEILFKREEIEAWYCYDILEDLFKKERPDLKTKYDNMLRDNELRERQAKIDDLKQQILQLDKEMQLIKETY
jgi:hypothetical protein